MSLVSDELESSMPRSLKAYIGCDADGVPTPKMTISQIRPNKIPLRETIIPRINAFHLGIYVCKASNKHGTIKYPFLIKIRGNEFSKLLPSLVTSLPFHKTNQSNKLR